MDCGSTCLRMLAKHYGKEYSIETLREICYTAKEGVSLLSISEAAEQLGFKTLGGRITFNKLINEALLPCIVHWNQEHFVIVYKVRKSSPLSFWRGAGGKPLKIRVFQKKVPPVFITGKIREL